MEESKSKMTVQSLSGDDLRAIEHLARTVGRGEGLSQARLDEIVAAWEEGVRPGHSDRSENFSIARPNGTTTGIVGPRWIFHLLGLRHRAVHVALQTPTGLVVMQRRSSTKQDWPGAADMAVAGHIPQQEEGGDLTYEAGAWKEIAEEIGLTEEDAPHTLVEKSLTAIGEPYCSFDSDLKRTPRFLNAEVRQVYGATLTGEGLAKIRFVDGEASGLLMVAPETAWNMLAGENIASGLRYSLPRYLDWLEKRPAD